MLGAAPQYGVSGKQSRFCRLNARSERRDKSAGRCFGTRCSVTLLLAGFAATGTGGNLEDALSQMQILALETLALEDACLHNLTADTVTIRDAGGYRLRIAIKPGTGSEG